MPKDIFLLDIPNFEPQYNSDTIYSYEGDGKENLKKVLIKASRGYCMYCYAKVLVDRKNFGHLEHSIEKVNCDKLVNCLANISITCSKCNLSFKKRGDNQRRLTVEEINNFEQSTKCSTKCLNSCEEYKKLRNIYIKKSEAEIILQPFGVKSEKTNKYYLIQYDILNQKFIPSILYEYTDEEKLFIERHINRFNLNDTKYRTKEFSKFIEDVVEYKAIPKKDRYCNLIVDLFIESLEGFSKEKVIKICEFIYKQLVIKNKL